MPNEKIALLLDQPRFGGAERALILLARGFEQQGHPVDFLVRDRREGAYLDELPEEVQIREIPNGNALALRGYLARRLPHLLRTTPGLLFGRKALPAGMTMLPGLVDYLRAERPASLLTTMPQNNVLALWARQLAGVSTRVAIREANNFSHSRLSLRRSKQGIMRLATEWYPKADAIVSVCDGVGDDLAESLSIPRQRIQTIHNPVDLEGIARLAAAPAPHPWLSDKAQPILLTIGRMNEQKDHRTLLRALAQLNLRRPARLIHLGEGGLHEDLQAECSRLGLTDQVQWAGNTANPYAYMARADAFVLSSAWEGLPNVLLEALACRTPIVSTDAAGGGPAELLQNGRFGRLVAVGDAAALADAIEGALAAPGDLEAGYRHVQGFTMERAATRYLSVMFTSKEAA